MPKQIGDLKLYTLDEISKDLQVTKLTLRTYIKSGKLKASKLSGRWHVSEDSLRQYFEGDKTTGN